jgi:hypothetical protein
MLCKKNDFPNNPLYTDTSEIRLPDKTFDKCRKLPNHVIFFWRSLFDLEFGHIKFAWGKLLMRTFSFSKLISLAQKREAGGTGADTWADQIHHWNTH